MNYATSAQAILRAKIARLERLLKELEQNERDIATILAVINNPQQKESR